MYVPAWPIPTLDLLRRRGPGRPPPFPFSAKHQALFGLGRAAMYHVCQALRERSIVPALMPDYHYGVEIEAARAAGMPIVFYRVRRDLGADLDHVAELCRRHRGGALFVTHYLGWAQPMHELAPIADRERLLLVEDCALALFSKLGRRPLGTWGAAAVFCLYKTLPVPDGGMLVAQRLGLSQPRPLSRPGLRTAFGRPLGLGLAWARSRGGAVAEPLVAAQHVLGRLLERCGSAPSSVGSTSFRPEDVHRGISPLSRHLARRLSARRVVALRRRNFKRIAASLAAAGLAPPFALAPGVCPLLFPVLAADAAAAARAFRRRGIEALELWNLPQAGAGNPSEDTRWLRAHLLGLPVHQGLSASQLDWVIEQGIALRGLVLDSAGDLSPLPRGAEREPAPVELSAVPVAQP